MNRIDFVILWVDGADKAWLKQKAEYSPIKEDYSSAANRFRDWGNLQYLFRGIEQFAPWVNNVFFITWGHLPKWLNSDHPKLRIVNHKDYIPAKYLPTFNSNCIELNLGRLTDLSETFVLFNDDTFLLKETREEDFFVNGTPCDSFSLNTNVPFGDKTRIIHTNINNLGVINRYYDKSNVLKRDPFKYFNVKYGKENLRTLLLLPWGGFTGIKNHHLPLSHLKSTFDVVWEMEPVAMDETCRNRFRGYNDLNHWLMRYWNLCKGNFVPRSYGFGRYFNLSNDNSEILSYITNQKGKTICINDMSTDFDYETTREALIDSFQTILPNKSTFEL